MNIILSSGGLDSAVIAATTPRAEHLFVDYGQRNLRNEAFHSREIAKYYGTARRYVDVRAWGAMVTSSLTTEHGSLIGADTVVPGRNAMLLSIAVSVAGPGGTVYIGCNATDHDIYPDCRPEFIAAFNDVAAICGVRVEAPLLYLTKKQIGERALDAGVPIDLTWSCYEGRISPCQECGACIARTEALACFR